MNTWRIHTGILIIILPTACNPNSIIHVKIDPLSVLVGRFSSTDIHQLRENYGPNAVLDTTKLLDRKIKLARSIVR